MATREKTAIQPAKAHSSTTSPAHLEDAEYEYLRNLMLEYVRSIDRNEIYTLGAAAVTMGFSLSSTNQAIAIGSALIPFVLILLAYSRYRGIATMCGTITDFMLERERVNRSIIWSSYQREVGAGSSLRKNRMLLWKALIAGSAIFLVFRVATATSETGAAPSDVRVEISSR